jgi:CBS domain-containing protein
MATVQSILNRKGSDVVTVTPDDTVLEAAHRMNDKRVGATVVCDAKGELVGIFTERDILRRVVAEDRSPVSTRVGDVMTSPVACCTPSTTVEECQSVITSKRLRHLPVVEEGKLVGMISSGDLIAREFEAQQTTIEYLHAYLQGRM